MQREIHSPKTLRGEVTPPGDKSVSHRAAILNAIAYGEARVTNFSPGADCQSTLTCLKALGVEIKEMPSHLRIVGKGKEGLREPDNVLDAGNSGTTMRLLTGVLAALPFLSIITGDSSLRSRPMGRLIHPLRLMGATIWGRGSDTLAPLAVKGGELKGIEYRLPVASAQLKSALLIAGIFARGQTMLEEPAPSRDHTERMLRAMGVKLEAHGSMIVLSPGTLSAMDVQVPGDISSAAFWLVAGVIHPNSRIKVKGVGINPTRTGIIDVLRAMGGKLQFENTREVGGEPMADITVESSELVGAEIGGALIPRVIDEIPVIAVAAALASGKTVVRDAAELRAKESDRIGTVVKELSKFGAKVEELPDGMIIHGGNHLKAAVCHSHLDHRLAMSLAVGGMVSKGRTVVAGAEAVDISYPGFWSDFERLSAG
ncbi:MAG: 3-phosphoshikimate 1-carboxyvinyltransferase [Chloroflexi bacterium]|nr:3-phosphoshikimate 1-carboxyvinyltransferase [Chloroflexota bacterium]